MYYSRILALNFVQNVTFYTGPVLTNIFNTAYKLASVKVAINLCFDVFRLFAFFVLLTL